MSPFCCHISLTCYQNWSHVSIVKFSQHVLLWWNLNHFINPFLCCRIPTVLKYKPEFKILEFCIGYIRYHCLVTRKTKPGCGCKGRLEPSQFPSISEILVQVLGYLPFLPPPQYNVYEWSVVCGTHYGVCLDDLSNRQLFYLVETSSKENSKMCGLTRVTWALSELLDY